MACKMGLIGPTEQDRLVFRMLSEAQTGAARERMRLQDDVERALTGGPVPLGEMGILDVDTQREAIQAHERVRFAFQALEGAEKVLEDVDANPAPNEMPARWRSAHDEVVLRRGELLKAIGAAYALRSEIERKAHTHGERNHRGHDLDRACAKCGHAFREHADGPCMWPVDDGDAVGMCGCNVFAPSP